MDRVKESCGRYPDKTLADCGYNSLKNLGEVATRGSEAIIPLEVEYKSSPEHNCEQVRKGEGEREYYCLADRRLHLACRGQDGYLIFKKADDFCQDCPFAGRCKFKDKKGFQILDDEQRTRLTSHLQKTRSESFKEDYRWRKAIVEPVFGNIKNKGIRIYVRGYTAVSNWWKIVASAHNIEKILRHILKSKSPIVALT